MNNVTQILTHSELTQAHRDAMAYVQDLAVMISQQGIYAVSAEYTGHVHEFSARVLRYTNIAKGNFEAESTWYVKLPGRYPFACDNALAELQAMARELEALLTPPTGGNAA